MNLCFGGFSYYFHDPKENGSDLGHDGYVTRVIFFDMHAGVFEISRSVEPNFHKRLNTRIIIQLSAPLGYVNPQSHKVSLWRKNEGFRVFPSWDIIEDLLFGSYERIGYLPRHYTIKDAYNPLIQLKHDPDLVTDYVGSRVNPPRGFTYDNPGVVS